MTLGEKIQRLRKSRGWSQEELSAQLGISRQALSRWEQNSALPDLEKILALSRLFQISTDALLKEELDPLAPSPAHTPSSVWTVAGTVIVILCLIGLLILGIFSSVFPAVYAVSPAGVNWTRVYSGLWGFLKSNGLEWLFWLCCFGTAVGLAMAFRIRLGHLWHTLVQNFKK